MKVVVISHTSIVTAYQDRLKALSAIDGIELFLVVPKRYQENLAKIRLKKKTDPAYKIFPLFPFTFGINAKTLINVTHFYPELPGILHKVQPDIIDIIEEPYSFITTYTILLKKLLCPDAKICFFSAQNIEKNYPLPFSLFEKFVFAEADLAFPVSREVKQILWKKGYHRKIQVLPLGINKKRYFDDQKLHQNKDPLIDEASKQDKKISGTVVGFMGRLVPEKGIYDLIDALKKISEENWTLFIMGRGPERKNIEKKCQDYGISNRVIIKECTFEEVPRYLNCIDLMVMPSKTVPHWKEQFGRVVIESWGCGVPVIGSDSGEIAEVIGNKKYVFEEGNIIQIAELMKKFIKNRQYGREMLDAGKKRLDKLYTWEKVAQKTYVAYKKIAGKNAGLQND